MANPDDKHRERLYLYRVMSYVMLIPGMIIIGPFVGYFMGYQIDNWLNSDPWFKLIGIGCGFAAGIRESIIIAKKVLKMRE